MIPTIVTPERANLDISVILPDAYIGKQVHVLFYTDDEVNGTMLPRKKPSDFAGTLSKVTAEELLKNIETYF